MIRVLLVADARPNRLVEPQWQHLARWLPRDEFELHLIVLGRPGQRPPDVDPGFAKSTFLTCRGSGDLVTLGRLWKTITSANPVVVHSQSNRFRLPIQAFARSIGAAFIETIGPTNIPKNRARFRQAILGRPDRAVIQTAQLAGPLPQDDLLVTVPPMVDPSRFGQVDRQTFYRQIGIPADSRLLVTAGDGSPDERTRDIIWACDLVKCLREDHRLLVLVDGPVRSQLERLVGQCLIHDLVRFIDPQPDLAIAAQHSELFLTASLHPATELLLTAMATGTTVVASDLQEHRALVSSGETGFITPSRDRAGFARLINKLLDDGALRHRVGRAGQAVAAQRYAPSRLAAEYAKIYRRVVRSARN